MSAIFRCTGPVLADLDEDAIRAQIDSYYAAVSRGDSGTATTHADRLARAGWFRVIDGTEKKPRPGAKKCAECRHTAKTHDPVTGKCTGANAYGQACPCAAFLAETGIHARRAADTGLPGRESRANPVGTGAAGVLPSSGPAVEGAPTPVEAAAPRGDTSPRSEGLGGSGASQESVRPVERSTPEPHRFNDPAAVPLVAAAHPAPVFADTAGPGPATGGGVVPSLPPPSEPPPVASTVPPPAAALSDKAGSIPARLPRPGEKGAGAVPGSGSSEPNGTGGPPVNAPAESGVGAPLNGFEIALAEVEDLLARDPAARAPAGVFEITDIGKAAWVIGKLLDRAAQRDRLKEQFRRMDKELERDLQGLAYRFGPDLEEWLRRELAKLPPRKEPPKSVKTLQGTLGSRTVKGAIAITDEAAVTAWALAQADPEDFGRYVSSFKIDVAAVLAHAAASGEDVPGLERTQDRENYYVAGKGVRVALSKLRAKGLPAPVKADEDEPRAIAGGEDEEE